MTDKVGNDWVFYHAVATKHPEGRVLMMDKIKLERRMACGSYGFSLIEIGKTCIVINKYIKI